MNRPKEPRKYTKAPMTLNRRLVLEALRKLGTANTYAIADESGVTRDSAKNLIPMLIKQGFIVRTKACVPNGRGRTAAEYKWSGKTFPASVAVFNLTDPMRADMALVVASINAMVHAGRASV